MQIDVISIFPEMFRAMTGCGITRVASDKDALDLRLHNPRDYAEGLHRAVDDRPYGGGPGMVMKAEPLARCIDKVKERNAGELVYLSPQGELLNQDLVGSLAGHEELILLAGRYEGIDERIIETRVDREISIGDYVLAGGEIAAMVLVESMARLLPGVLGNELSAKQDSFSSGLLDCPHFTRPEVFEGRSVPQVLLSGDHDRIRRWRNEQAMARTRSRRPDLIENMDIR